MVLNWECCLIGEGAYLSEYGLYSKNQNEENSLYSNVKNLYLQYIEELPQTHVFYFNNFQTI